MAGSTQPAGTQRATGVDPQRAARALGRYRVMAYVTGVMLLVLTLEIVLKYLVHANGYVTADDGSRHPAPVIGSWVAFVHGWVYVVYLVTVIDAWSRMRWRLGRLALMVLGGVVPVMSFVVEHRLHGRAAAELGAPAGSGSATTLGR